MTDYSSKTDELLVLLCRADNKDAWTELYMRYASVSKTLSLKFGGGINSETDDLIQEGMIAFLSAVHSYREDKKATFKTYAWTCIRNRILNAVKSGEYKMSVLPDGHFYEEEREVPDYSMTPEEQLISKNEAENVMYAITHKLSEKEQAVFRLYLSGKTYDEIASALSMSNKGVDGALQRARKKLKAELGVQ